VKALIAGHHPRRSMTAPTAIAFVLVGGRIRVEGPRRVKGDRPVENIRPVENHETFWSIAQFDVRKPLCTNLIRYWRMIMARRRCLECGKPFDAQRPQAKYCGSTCRGRVHRRPKPAPVSRIGGVKPQVNPSGGSTVVEAVTAELTAAGCAGSALGVQAVVLARRLL
jgi:hypothetical protein